MTGAELAGRVARTAAASVARHYGTVAALVVLPVVAAGCVGLMLFAGGGFSSPPPGCGHTYKEFAGNARILATIRSVESGGDYEVRITTSTALGAYAFIDAAWRHYAASVGVDVARYPSAWMAPPAAQDAAVNAYLNEILATHQGRIEIIPLAWYLPVSIRRPELLDVVPAGGNVLTPREYQQRWLDHYARQDTPPAATAITVTGGAGSPTTTSWAAAFTAPALDEHSCVDALAAATYTAPAAVTSLAACQISWGGHRPGDIPASAMRYSTHSGLMHPAASAAWDQLWDAANRAGLDLDGSGYRPGTQSSGASCSNHYWGLAIDVAALTGSAGFDSPEYRWLAANAHRFGYANPDWARPVDLGGTGQGGYAGGHCCQLEPWHWEFVAFLQLPTI